MRSAEFLDKIRDLKFISKDLNFESVQHKFEIYADFLIEENKKYNLTSITDIEEIYLKHFYDSCILLNYVSLDNKSVIDVGSGAGFPGIPLAILCENSNFVLVEPTTKRANFLKEVVNRLSLNNVLIVNERAEKLPKDMFEKYDIGTCRAVANLNVISELITPFIKLSGYFIPYKSNKVDDEIINSKNALSILKCKIEKVEKLYLSENMNDERSFIFIKKIDHCNKKYPRDYSLISNKPLK